MPITNRRGITINASRGPVIDTPKGSILINSATMKAELKWKSGAFSGGNSGGGNNWQGQFSAAQRFVDSEVLRGCEPYLPLLTSMLIKSGILGTDVGSGTVQWITPYAHFQYYLKRPVGTATGPLRGPFWFARWKPVGGPRVIAGARKIAGGGQ